MSAARPWPGLTGAVPISTQTNGSSPGSLFPLKGSCIPRYRCSLRPSSNVRITCTGRPGPTPQSRFFIGCSQVVFAYHRYPWLIHPLVYRRHGHDGFHVRGHKGEGTTTTPFDMVT